MQTNSGFPRAYEKPCGHRCIKQPLFFPRALKPWKCHDAEWCEDVGSAVVHSLEHRGAPAEQGEGADRETRAIEGATSTFRKSKEFPSVFISCIYLPNAFSGFNWVPDMLQIVLRSLNQVFTKPCLLLVSVEILCFLALSNWKWAC